MTGLSEERRNRAPGTIWSLRLPGDLPNGFIRTTDDDRIKITYYDRRDYHSITLGRRDARLLAKRITECLDRTVKR